jgi:hypothetical protein
MTKDSNKDKKDLIKKYKFKYKSKNAHFIVWERLKQDGIVRVAIAQDSDVIDYFRKSLAHMKKLDTYYKVCNMLELGYCLHLNFDICPDKGEIIVKLVDKVDNLNPINIL